MQGFQHTRTQPSMDYSEANCWEKFQPSSLSRWCENEHGSTNKPLVPT